MNKLYKIIFLCTLFFVVALTAFTQQNHFVYVQTENKQPFYIKLKNKLLSSSASGYLIIPKLQDGSYEFTIGFPKNEWSEQIVTCAVNKKDAGYLLKDFGDKGWGLFNLQTMEVVMPGNTAAGNKTIIEEVKKDPVTITPPLTVAIDSAMVKKTEDKPLVKEEVKPLVDAVKKDPVTITPPLTAAIDSAMVKKTEDKPFVKEEVKPVVDTVKKDPVTITPPLTAAIDSAMVKKTEDKPFVKEEVKPVVDTVKKDPVTITPPLPVTIDSAIVKKTEDKPLVKEEEKPVVDTVKKEPATIATPLPVTIDSAFVKKTEDKPVIKDAKSPALITKLLSANTADGAEMIYVDNTNAKADTVRVFIPAEKDTAKGQVQPQKKQEEPKVELQKVKEAKPEKPKIETKKEITKATDTKFIDITLPNPNAKPDTAVKQVKPEIIAEKKSDTNAVIVPEKQKENIQRPALPNSDCKAQASEDDFLKLRKKMVAEANDDDMVDVARKIFRIKCFTTAQIKNLCVLFLNDEGRYKFIDTAYPFVSDSFNFGTLETLLTDNYFITRFKAMIRH
jgi:hypothetical protein